MQSLIRADSIQLGILRVALVTALILMIPWVAMQFTSAVDWKAGDFIVIGALLFGSGLAYEVISRRVDKKYRLPIGLATLAFVLYIWAELAVGIFTNWGS